jgi:D-amino-acid oxidase
MGPRITVVGAGVNGLTSAIRLAEAGHTVDVLARELPLETTSAVAGGVWLPYLAEPVVEVARWSRRTFEVMRDLIEDADRPGLPPTGIAMRDGYLLGTGPTRPDWSASLGDLVELSPVANPAPGHASGWHLRVPLVDMTVYLPYLVARLKAAGGTLTRLPLTALPARGLVVNCAGLASRALASDPGMHPIRGQVVWLSNPGLTTWWSDETEHDSELTYVLPHPRHVVVGGTAQRDNWSLDADPASTERMVERARELVPALRNATVLGQRVGLRPARNTVRVETVRELERTVVHNYGHGGSGITLSWGCADDVLTAVTKITAAVG